jgi:putative DNA methylase
MGKKTDRPRVLIEQWLPIDQIGAECMRERGASSALPPLYFLHVWWARRPLTVCRAAILASLLPAYPTDEDEGVRPWPAKFCKRFPTFSDYKAWFNRLVGIHGDPVKSRKIIDWAKTNGVKLTPEVIRKLPHEWRTGLPNDIGLSIPYGYPRAFTRNPDQQQLNLLYELLRWTWGTEDIAFCDPMSGGGSIPFEALRFGLTVHANELNPVASVILKATLDYPARFGPSLINDIRKYGSIWCKKVRKRLETYYPLVESKENIFAYLWARTVACPVTGNPVPLSPNWWLRKGPKSVAIRLIADPKTNRCRYELVEGKTACAKVKPDQGTIRHGTGLSPWTGEAIDGDYIKAEAQAGRMGHDLYALGIKMSGSLSFRSPANADEAAICTASKELERQRSDWERRGWLPTEDIGEYSNYDRGHRLYGINTWQEFFSPRQLLAFATAVPEAGPAQGERTRS